MAPNLMIICGVLLVASFCNAAGQHDWIPTGYSRLTLPKTPTEVQVSFHITDMELKDRRMNVVVYQRMHWRDERLARAKGEDLMFKTQDVKSDIWSPDLFYPNAVEPSGVINEGFVRVLPDGTVKYSRMTKESLGCPEASIGAHSFTCSIEIESYAYTTENIAIKPVGTTVPLTMSDSVKNMTMYRVSNNKMVHAQEIALSSGNYSKLSFQLDFERQ